MLALDRLFAAAPSRRIIQAAPHERQAVQRARIQIAAVVGLGLAALAASIAKQIRRREIRRQNRLDDIDDDERDDEIDRQAAEITRGLDLDWHSLIVPVGMALAYVALDQVERTLGRLGDFAALGPDAAQAVAAMAHDRAAAMVGMKYDDAGALVENPNPKWSIAQSTRDGLHDLIVKAIQEGQTSDELADAIASNAAFGPARAQLIANTEVSAIDNAASLHAFRTARDKGRLALKKVWVTGGDDPCQVCLDAEAEGPIDLDDEFDAGDAPPAHPSCYCFIAAVVGDS